MSAGVIHLTLEKIMRDWLASLTWSSSINFYSGVDKGTGGNEPLMKLPRCVVACNGATEAIKYTRIYQTQFELIITHSADDTTRETHAEMVAEILNTATDADNIASFNRTVDAHIYEIYPHQIEEDQESRNWQTLIILPMTAALGNVGA